jgi:hypothetical protein
VAHHLAVITLNNEFCAGDGFIVSLAAFQDLQHTIAIDFGRVTDHAGQIIAGASWQHKEDHPEHHRETR